jgi:acetyl esterase/lipase
MKIFYTLLLMCFVFDFASATDCYNGRYKEKVFSDYEVIKDVIYDRQQKSNGVWQDLMYDVYLPKNDTLTNRPAVVLAHGGGYIDLLDQRSPDIVKMAQELVLRGYVVFSLEYREEPTFLSLLSEEKMVKALSRSLIDIRNATCYLMDTTLNYNNPYGVDPQKVIIGGVSAGAVSFLHGVFLDSIDWVIPQYKEWILEIEPNTQALLDNKYCGATVIGLINVSGAIQDTAWIKAENVHKYPPMMHVHGTNDQIVPYDIDRPFGLPFLPKLMGSFPIDQKLQAIGVRSELDTWNGLGHVPFFGFEIEELFGDNPIDFLFTPVVLDPTIEHMVEFCYSLIDCNEIIVTGLDLQKTQELGFYPNPAPGQFTIDFPTEHLNQSGILQITNSAGQVVYIENIPFGTSSYMINHPFSKGYYTISVSYDGVNRSYAGQLMVLK